ncbi:uncharacterized protein BT62DRAFT_997025 [Guyanagaster necrorhizus]|uniref:Uncharacterized protein n=1 Tax=Guyanagaster necrorhizus TaxID=856835 RepID=A0A9P7VIL8_9AGAR|nr:uncharacterized protein BT62DRAFT_997025 [Guyanagaster necrorhizus MCA 3950]KAG7441751.1 hypothetical protein BT62DRAFT_997025 [Guyanagaster necrorhizus MCA 3950]
MNNRAPNRIRIVLSGTYSMQNESAALVPSAMNDATAESLSLLLLLGHQNNAVSELRRAMSSLRLVESYLNQGELLLRSIIRLQSSFDVPFHETSPPMSPLLLPSRRSSHDLLKAAANILPPLPPKSPDRLPAMPLEKTRPSVDEFSDKSCFPIRESKRARRLRRITKRIPSPGITESLKAEVAAGLSLDHDEPTLVEPVPSSSRVESTVFLVIEDGVATKHKLLKPFPRKSARRSKKKNVIQRALGWALRRDV